MPRRHPNPWTQQVAPKGLPGDGARRRNDPLLPKLPLPQPRVVSSAGAPTGSRASGGDDGWWQSSGGGSPRPELGVGVRSAPRRLPTLPIVAPRAAQDSTKLSSLLLPPLLLAGAPRAPAPRRPRPEGGEDPCSRSAREAPHPLLALLGELVPSKFRVFLQRLGAECALATQPTSSAWQSKKSVSGHCQHPLQCPHCPDLRGQSSYLQNSLKKIGLHQIPALGTLRRDHPQFATLKKANHRPHGVQAPKLKAVLTHGSLGDGSGKRRRFCPFRVRFADETLRDTALRYWERSCTVQQGLVANGLATRSTASERVFQSVGRWLETCPRAPCPRAEEEAAASIWPPQKPQGYLSKDASMNSSLHFVPRATTQRPQSGLKTFLGTHSSLEQVDGLPGSWGQKLAVVENLPPWARGAPRPGQRPHRAQLVPPCRSRSPSCPAWCCTRS
ncbi:uncharacterized protein C9orf50 homolog isoform X3 [Hyaena hyaena]|uniref:uncharacterized protein C9orf50 homolog isoform X3 n=1 Tax=Hyaena hyaena TaxID=95912 RepID=UPI0019221D05|nr:uncharacterized protein C9orf50 homolog isoform X3 [Hyaena hyaena]